MTGNPVETKPEAYWDRAGEQGYGQAMYRSSDVRRTFAAGSGAWRSTLRTRWASARMGM